MRVLVINSGSSSLKFSLYETRSSQVGTDPHPVLDGELSGIGDTQAALKFTRAGEQIEENRPELGADTPAKAAAVVLDLIAAPDMPRFDAVGYRVVHPGAKLVGHQRITPEVFRELEQAIEFAPLHDPAVLEVIRAAMDRYPQLAHYACFDTEFHRTMPEEAAVYAIPKQFREAGVRRYGFHGLSCESVLHQMQQRAEPLPERLVIAHLGSGCSVTAVRDGRSVDTSMGLTPDGGVVMGTRPGDLDPGLVVYLFRQQQKSMGMEAASDVEHLLNYRSGMVALSGLENNMKTVRQVALGGSAEATLALKVFTRGIRKTIGSFAWLLGGLDAIVFTGGIGEHDGATRTESLSDLEAFGIHLDASLNAARTDGMTEVSAYDSKTSILIAPAQEDLMIAMHVARMAESDQ
jgi:acetate kinase